MSQSTITKYPYYIYKKKSIEYPLYKFPKSKWNSLNSIGIPEFPKFKKKCQNYQIPLIHPLTPSQIKILERNIILSNAKNIPSIFKLHDWCIWCIWWERFFFMNSFEFAKYPYSIYIHYIYI